MIAILRRNKGVEQGFGDHGWAFFRRYCRWESGTGTVFTSSPEGTKVEAWEGRIFTCSRPHVSVAAGCIVTVSAVYLPKKRPGLPAPGPLYRILFGWSRLLYTSSSGRGIFSRCSEGSQVLLLFYLVLTG